MGQVESGSAWECGKLSQKKFLKINRIPPKSKQSKQVLGATRSVETPAADEGESMATNQKFRLMRWCEVCHQKKKKRNTRDRQAGRTGRRRTPRNGNGNPAQVASRYYSAWDYAKFNLQLKCVYFALRSLLGQFLFSLKMRDLLTYQVPASRRKPESGLAGDVAACLPACWGDKRTGSRKIEERSGGRNVTSWALPKTNEQYRHQFSNLIERLKMWVWALREMEI